MSTLKDIKTTIPRGRYFIYAAVFFAIFISNIITTKRNKTITAPTQTSIKIIDKNSAFNINHNTADEKNVKTRLIADLTGLLTVITPIALTRTSAEKIRNIISSIFMASF